jgi:hypothetical protein
MLYKILGLLLMWPFIALGISLAIFVFCSDAFKRVVLPPDVYRVLRFRPVFVIGFGVISAIFYLIGLFLIRH